MRVTLNTEILAVVLLRLKAGKLDVRTNYFRYFLKERKIAMKNNMIMPIIEGYGAMIAPEQDMTWEEAQEIRENSRNEMEVIGNSYILGMFRGRNTKECVIPVLEIPFLSDERWNEIAKNSSSTACC